MTGGREGSAPAEPLSRILSVGVLRCRRDSDKTRECFRKFGHKAGQAERPELPNAGGAGQEEPGNRRGWVWGTEGEPSGLVTGGRWAGFSPWLTKYPKGQCRTSQGSAKRFALAAPGLRPTGCLTPHPVSQMAAA